MTTFAITGATGQLGRLVIQSLKEKVSAEQVIALVRNPAKAADLGVSTRVGDYKDVAGLERALQGVDKLLLISSNDLGNRVQDHKNVIDAAKKAGVKHIVYTSLLRADTSPLSVAAEHPATEADLKASGMMYTILRNGWYTENYTSSIPAALANGAFYGSAGEGQIASASRQDYADAAVAVLTQAGHEHQIYELAGDQAYTLAQLAAALSKQVGRDIPYVDIPEADYAKALADAGVPADFARIIAGWDTDAKQGALYSEDKTLSQLIDRPTTSLEAMIQASLLS